MRGTFPTVALAAMLAAASAAAEDCDSAETQADMTACADAAYRAADAKLNAAYKAIASRLTDDADARKLLVAAERAWIAFRDAECAFATSAASGGSIQPMLVASCRERLTAARATDLESYLHCEEGDLACPVPPGE